MQYSLCIYCTSGAHYVQLYMVSSSEVHVACVHFVSMCWSLGVHLWVVYTYVGVEDNVINW